MTRGEAMGDTRYRVDHVPDGKWTVEIVVVSPDGRETSGTEFRFETEEQTLRFMMSLCERADEIRRPGPGPRAGWPPRPPAA